MWLARRFSAGAGVADVGRHPIVRAGLTFLCGAALSTALSAQPLTSFFGSFDRSIGWLTLAAGAVLLLSGADLLTDERRRERVITMLCLGAMIPCAYFLLQRVGLDPITWTALGEPGSTLASPTFVGGYLVIVAPLVLYRVTRCAGGASLGYACGLALLLIVCAATVLTTIRGPMLGLVAALLTFALAARLRRRFGRTEILAAIGILVAAVALAVVATGGSGAAGLQRFLNIARAGDSSLERVTVWRDAMHIPLADPMRALFGYGPEMQSVALEHGEATVRLTQNQQWDRAHDLVLDTWLTTGIVGVATLGLAIGLAIHAALLARHTHRLLAAGILAALVGHLVEASFAFHTVVTDALFWVLLALAASLTPRWGAQRPISRRWLVALSTLLGIALVPVVASPAVADAIYGRARQSNYLDGAELEELAGQWAPWVEELPRAAALDWQRVATIRNDPAARARAEADLLEAAARAPAQPVPVLRLSRWYLQTGDLPRAEQACERALELGPYRATVWEACADVAAAQGRSDIAPGRRARGEELRQPL